MFLRLRTKPLFGILLQRGIAISDCEAAALPGRFLPELGRSSERPFFCAALLGAGGVAAALMDVKSNSLAAPGQPPKLLAQKRLEAYRAVAVRWGWVRAAI